MIDWTPNKDIYTKIVPLLFAVLFWQCNFEKEELEKLPSEIQEVAGSATFSCDPPCVKEDTEEGEMICVPKLSGSGGKVDVVFGKKAIQGKKISFIVTESWITISEQAEHHYVVHYSSNEKTSPRQAEITFTVDNTLQAVVIDQLSTPTLTIEPSADIEVSYLRGDTILEISASESVWIASLDPVIDWISIETDPEENTLSISYQENQVNTERETILQVSIQDTEVNQNITFTQEARPSIRASFRENDHRKGYVKNHTLFVSEHDGGQITEIIDISIQSKDPSWDVFLTARINNTNLNEVLDPSTLPWLSYTKDLTENTLSIEVLEYDIDNIFDIYLNVFIEDAPTILDKIEIVLTPLHPSIISLPATAGEEQYTIGSQVTKVSKDADWLSITSTQTAWKYVIGYQANPSSERVAYISFLNDHAFYFVRAIKQAGKPVVSIVNYQTDATITLPPTSGNQVLDVTITQGWDWIATASTNSQTDWLSLSDNQQTDQLTITYPANPTQNARSIELIVQVKDFRSEQVSLTVQQAGKPSVSIVNYQTDATITLPPTSGNQVLDVTISEGWDWIATASTNSQTDWLSLSDNQQTDQLTITYPANLTQNARSIELTVQVKDFRSEQVSLTVQQAGKPSVSIVNYQTDATITLPPTSGNQVLDVTISEGWDWIATASTNSQTDWLSLSDNQQTDQLTITYPANPTQNARSIELIVQVKDFRSEQVSLSVQQAGLLPSGPVPSNICVYRSLNGNVDYVIPDEGAVNLPTDAGDTVFDVTLLTTTYIQGEPTNTPIPGDWTFTKNTSDTWFSLSQSQDKSKIRITFQLNSGPTRTAEVLIASKEHPEIRQSIVLWQASTTATLPNGLCVYRPLEQGGVDYVIPDAGIVNLPTDAGDTVFDVTLLVYNIPIPGDWTFTKSTSDTWFSLSQSQDKSKIRITFQLNSGPTRTATISVASKAYPTIGQTIVLSQASTTATLPNGLCVYRPLEQGGVDYVIPDEGIVNLPTDAGDTVFDVTLLVYNIPIPGDWTFTKSTSDTWFSLSQSQDKSKIRITFQLNSGPTRTATISVASKAYPTIGQTIILSQASAPDAIEVSLSFYGANQVLYTSKLSPGENYRIGHSSKSLLYDVKLLLDGSPVRGEWTVSKTANATWVTLSRTSNGQLQIDREKNMSGEERQVEITVASKVKPSVQMKFTLTQLSGLVPNGISIYYDSYNGQVKTRAKLEARKLRTDYTSGDFVFYVRLLSGRRPIAGKWTVSKPASASWIQLTQTQDVERGGPLSLPRYVGQLGINFEKNSSGTKRHAEITVASKVKPSVQMKFTIEQMPNPSRASLSVYDGEVRLSSRSTVKLPSASGGRYKLGIGIAEGIEWSAIKNFSSYTWFTFDSDQTNDTVFINYEANTDARKRHALITIRVKDAPSTDIDIWISQKPLQRPDIICVYKDDLTVSPEGTIYLPSDSGSVDYTTTLAIYEYGGLRGINGEWAVEGDTPNDWFAIRPDHVNKRLTIQFETNPSSANSRSAKIIIRSKFFPNVSFPVFLEQKNANIDR